MSADFDAMTAMELRARIARREISPVEVTRRALDKAQATQASLNAFFLLMPEQGDGRGEGGRGRGDARRCAWAAARRAVLGQGPDGGRRRALRLRLALHGGQRRGGRRAVGRARESGRRHPDRQDHHQRVRLQGGRRQPAHRHHPQSVESRQRPRADRARAPRPRSPAASRRSRSAPTAAARCASPAA